LGSISRYTKAYHNSIIQFQVTADDLTDEPFVANSASGAWKKIIDRILQQGFSAKTHASGPQLYGLSDWGVMKAVQVCNNINNYIQLIITN
jgi:hypothetical protein